MSLPALHFLAGLPVLFPGGIALLAAAGGGDYDVLQMIVDSGRLGIAFMVVLGLFSLAALAVVLERLVNLRRGKLLPAGLVREVQELVRVGEDDPARFRAVCERYAAPMAKILKAGLARAGRPLAEVEKSMEDALAREMAELRSRVRPLSIIASVAPLVGLLGTVVGMIVAFRTASQAGLGRGADLAEGIYLALLTTAAGLTIAVPALLFAAFFNNRIDRLMRETDEQLTDVIPAFARMEQPGAEPLASAEPR
jgi:biopolymer transport protein ExbB